MHLFSSLCTGILQAPLVAHRSPFGFTELRRLQRYNTSSRCQFSSVHTPPQPASNRLYKYYLYPYFSLLSHPSTLEDAKRRKWLCGFPQFLSYLTSRIRSGT